MAVRRFSKASALCIFSGKVIVSGESWLAGGVVAEVSDVLFAFSPLHNDISAGAAVVSGFDSPFGTDGNSGGIVDLLC